MDWIDLAQDMDRCRALMNAIMNYMFHKMWGVSSLDVSQGFCPI